MSALKENLGNRQTWMRVLYMLLFVLLYGVAEVVVTAVVLFQLGATLVTGEENERLRNFGRQLATYLYQVVAYLTFAREARPFPFSPWPGDEVMDPAEYVAEDQDGG